MFAVNAWLCADAHRSRLTHIGVRETFRAMDFEPSGPYGPTSKGL